MGLAVGTILKNLVEKKKGWEFKAAKELGISKDLDLEWYRLREFLGIRVSFCECEDFQEFQLSLEKEIENWDNFYNNPYLVANKIKVFSQIENMR